MLTTALVATLLALAPGAIAQGDDAEITVEFSEDGMTFNVTSSKDISNIIVEDCEGATHKHDGLDGHWFNHTETFVVAAVYVKSGSNNDEGPPGSGERFENEDADCEEEPPCVDDPQTPADECAEEPPCTDDPQTPEDECDETEIPFFPGFTALALGSLAAIGTAGYMLRSRRT